MKKLLPLALALLASGALAQSGHYVRPHVTKNGTYVEGHYRSNPDGNRLNNYGTQGNLNPYTGQQGTVNPYAPSQQPGYVAPMQPLQPYQPYRNPYGR